MDGISSLQGGHQVAQKLRKTTRPLKSLSLSDGPARPGTAKSGAELDGAGRMRLSTWNGSSSAASAGSGDPATRRPHKTINRAAGPALRRPRMNGLPKRSIASPHDPAWSRSSRHHEARSPDRLVLLALPGATKGLGASVQTHRG